ncbi:CapA family protein [Aurantibacter crassamenti]|uniref:CapA family protein n=1 Tax=Aurantibacter crassamenti TaxID=1837375 RepID=UPI00193A7489|nr:CapA family protein [Aurantibacter crassamenti]MBM1106768.1 CapA family protein [Aurantibacter crassamenti]
MNEILVTGDIYLGAQKVEELAEQGEVQQLFGDFLPIIQDCAFSITNLECPTTDVGSTILKTGPILKASPKSLSALKKAGFNLLTMANNHILDYGQEGLKKTTNECDKLNINYVGVGKSLNDARKAFNFDLNNQKIAILNISENEFSTTQGEYWGANPMDPINNSYDIKNAKINNDKVIVIVHGGREHYNLPSPNFQKTLRFYVDCGADAVIAHHTHCVSGYENYNQAPIFYGLGNFLFKKPNNPRKPLWNKGLAVKLIIKENVIDFRLIPYIQGHQESPMIEVMQGKKKDDFLNDLDKLNDIITDEVILSEHWKNYIKTQHKYYKNKLFINNKWLQKFSGRNIIPFRFLTNKEHYTFVTNLIKCETHREILIDSLEKDKKSTL